MEKNKINSISFDEYMHMLKDIRLDGLENVNTSEFLAIMYFDLHYKYSLSKLFINYLLLSSLQRKGRSEKIVFLFTDSYYGRKDYVPDMHKVIKTAPRSTLLYSARHIHFHIKNIQFLRKWYKNLSCVKLPRRFKIYLCLRIFGAYNFTKDVIKIIDGFDTDPKLIVTFCDTHMTDYLITKYYNDNKVPTATLQHASFSAIGGWFAYKYSHSNYFLATNQYSKDQAMRSNYSSVENIVICGPLKYIGTEFKIENRRTNKNIIGVAFGGNTSTFYEETQVLLGLIKKFHEDNDKKIIIKMHPGNIFKLPDEYSYCTILQPNISVSDFADMCDLVFTGSSNIFVDLLCLACPVFRLTSAVDLYEDLERLKFNTIEEGLAIIRQFYSDNESSFDDMQEVRNYFLPDDIENNYKEFFEKFV